MNYSKHVEVRHKRSKEGIIEYKAASRNLFLYVKVTQSCTTLCSPMNYTVHAILQARILEWVAFPFSRGSSQPRD